MSNFAHRELLVKTLQYDPSRPPRIIIVGDIHGCLDEFESLLHQVHFKDTSFEPRYENDVLIITGDMVLKGDDSLGVVKKAMQIGAFSVMGNHEARLLDAAIRYRSGKNMNVKANSSIGALAVSLPDEVFQWLNALPHIIDIPEINTVVVHAGINPTHSLDQQKPSEVLWMRRLQPAEISPIVPNYQNSRLHTNVPLWNISSPALHAVASWKRKERWVDYWRGPTHVVFGHDARSGLQLDNEFATGLDTGLVYGGKLSALILNGEHGNVTRKRIVSVDALPKRYEDFTRSHLPPEKQTATNSPASQIEFSVAPIRNLEKTIATNKSFSRLFCRQSSFPSHTVFTPNIPTLTTFTLALLLQAAVTFILVRKPVSRRTNSYTAS